MAGEKNTQSQSAAPAAHAPAGTQSAPSSKKKKTLKGVTAGIAHILASFNNTVINITDKQGNTITWSTPGIVGYGGSRKSTPFAAQVAGTDAAKRAKDMGLRSVDVLVRGPGPGRESAIRALQAGGLIVTSIKDITPIPHNGCRAKKKRRV
ncbi:MAG: 30S ribosomal protein S11 [Candidatus Omnitrophica bacterium]|nr:30S ribosomal protein S11 [Candidatus Omnitrophota bacterium]MDD4940424.1 30S ribosomal protein S11 [Candidatus Omnitrophota bacterium]MDD5774819.1 30S ribosomal protein S11 [Candidatus Omnitrophota bacterium]HNQ51131.1 30S ribosomal protein S11 [Candidatus Omnitrophota bacterium]HQO38032.1 30S ribosomal protein S11 [Candidatus Omnitrophota bacterium]